MKRKVFVRMSVLLLTSAVVLSATALGQQAASKHCTLANVAGKWGFTISGTIPSIGPVAAIGKFTQDSSGNITGTETRSLNGDIADETLTGTAIVNSDCSGTDTFQVFEGGVLVRTSSVSVVYDDNRHEARALFTSVVLADGTPLPSILAVEAHQLFHAN
jgi:hypothetical protein